MGQFLMFLKGNTFVCPVPAKNSEHILIQCTTGKKHAWACIKYHQMTRRQYLKRKDHLHLAVPIACVVPIVINRDHWSFHCHVLLIFFPMLLECTQVRGAETLHLLKILLSIPAWPLTPCLYLSSALVYTRLVNSLGYKYIYQDSPPPPHWGIPKWRKKCFAELFIGFACLPGQNIFSGLLLLDGFVVDLPFSLIIKFNNWHVQYQCKAPVSTISLPRGDAAILYVQVRYICHFYLMGFLIGCHF